MIRCNHYVYKIVKEENLDVKPLISHCAPRTQAPEMFVMLEEQSEAVGALFDWPINNETGSDKI